MTLTEFKLVPAKLLENPKTAKFLNDVSHNIFQKMKLTPKPVVERKNDQKKKDQKEKEKTPEKEKEKTSERTSLPDKGEGFVDRRRFFSDTSMIRETPDKRSRLNRSDAEIINDLTLPTDDEDVFVDMDVDAESNSLDDIELHRLIPTRYKEQGIKLLDILKQDYDHTTESGQERLVELVNQYLFKHTTSLPQNWMYPVMHDRLEEIKALDIIPRQRQRLLNKKDLRTLQNLKSINLRSLHPKVLAGKGLPSIF
jgi:hypothetical protein